MSGDYVDARKETRVDWDKEITNGNLVEKKADEEGPQHVNGQLQTEDQMRSRVISAEVAKHVAETRRYPTRSSTLFFFGNGSRRKKQ
jgi:hypothetical protein